MTVRRRSNRRAATYDIRWMGKFKRAPASSRQIESNCWSPASMAGRVAPLYWTSYPVSRPRLAVWRSTGSSGAWDWKALRTTVSAADWVTTTATRCFCTKTSGCSKRWSAHSMERRTNDFAHWSRTCADNGS